jgi:hypothetical protein
LAVFLNNKVGLKLATIDLSDHVQSVTLNRTFDELSVVAMGDSSAKAVKGLETASVTIDFLNDTAAASVLPTLQAAYGTTVTLVLLQDKAAAVSATNPLYTMSVLVNNLTDINGAVGDISMQSVSFNCNSTVAVTTTGTF